MPTRVHLTERDRAQLEQLRECALTLRALEWATKEAKLDRDRLITLLMARLPRGGGATLASAAGISNAWPGRIADAYPEDRRTWSTEHRSRRKLLLGARERLELMLETNRGGQRGGQADTGSGPGEVEDAG